MAGKGSKRYLYAPRLPKLGMTVKAKAPSLPSVLLPTRNPSHMISSPQSSIP